MPKSLVFDEVEAGLGGRAALLAGLKLRDLSQRCQVLLVTHEAAIAALAEQHYVVRRDGNESAVFEIDGEERIGEIARMLAGDSQSREARKHAEALLAGTNTAPIAVDDLHFDD
jgi:DNA repair protein RecN (Recombination protein N)